MVPVTSDPIYIYLHGFASSPQSAKAKYLCDRIPNLIVPDLNQEDFFDLTLSRQIHQVRSLFPASGESIVLIGSSFGGLTAAWLAQHPQVVKAILLAPAFQFLHCLLRKLGNEQMHRWEVEGQISVYHYGHKGTLPLSYKFIRDLQQYRQEQLGRLLPTLILHGSRDEVIPLEMSQTYASIRPWVRLVTLDSDHGLADAMPTIWQAIQEFCPELL
ncbi:MAG: alpha/beta fold hydrolase [Coleofasciculaceae cyanobacterium SM2_3_26]|nr:alpha/beta fold hydrolase [Coleofasciculaceae cyanobacterium SM2_3_26]